MHVGVFLLLDVQSKYSGSLPHACGGVSNYQKLSFYYCVVFPMHVGVFPENIMANSEKNSLPHACGGVSS